MASGSTPILMDSGRTEDAAALPERLEGQARSLPTFAWLMACLQLHADLAVEGIGPAATQRDGESD
jgi:hypothetical protein